MRNQTMATSRKQFTSQHYMNLPSPRLYPWYFRKIYLFQNIT
uniref:Uncharacterized protein n=1 Tax=Arundo donax TaxID=35708 RepID=A0A0A9F664_ARUDO